MLVYIIVLIICGQTTSYLIYLFNIMQYSRVVKIGRPIVWTMLEYRELVLLMSSLLSVNTCMAVHKWVATIYKHQALGSTVH